MLECLEAGRPESVEGLKDGKLEGLVAWRPECSKIVKIIPHNSKPIFSQSFTLCTMPYFLPKSAALIFSFPNFTAS
jgi:hypothetical protein